jgi:glycosyltransferase involved in cell wall biosynthesis
MTATSSVVHRQPIRLLMVEPSSRLGGQEEVLFNLAVCLPEYGVEPRVLALRDGPMLARLRDAGVEVEVSAARLRQPSQVQRAVRVLDQHLRSSQFDAVFSNMPMAHLYAALPAALRSVPALWFQADYPDPPNWLHRMASRLPADAVLAASLASATAQRKLSPHRDVHQMDLGIDVAKFKSTSDPGLRTEYGIPADAPLVSIVGRLELWKGQRQFLRAAAAVAQERPDVWFAIVGGAILGWEGNYPDELEQLAASQSFADRIVFTGHTNQASRWFAASDITVNASSPEPFGLVIIEAMSAGCAVVAVNQGGPKDVVRSGINGVLVDAPEPRLIASAVLRLLSDPIEAKEIGREAQRHVAAHYTRESMAQRFDAILRSVIANRSGKARTRTLPSKI